MPCSLFCTQALPGAKKKFLLVAKDGALSLQIA